MAQYGRTVDIEKRLHHDARQVRRDRFRDNQGDEHEVRAFADVNIGNHPVLRTSTKNNMVDDSGDSPSCSLMCPCPSTRTARASGCWTPTVDQRVAYEELIKEDKLTHVVPDIALNRVDDPRRYALLDVNNDHSARNFRWR